MTRRRSLIPRTAPAVLLVLPALLPLLAGCSIGAPEPAVLPDDPGAGDHTGTPSWVRHDLFLGGSRQDGPDLTPGDWSRVRDRLTAHFPDGMTVLDAHGQWKGSDEEIIKEHARVFVVFSPAHPDTARKLIEEFAAWFRDAYGQESVLWASSPADVEFLQDAAED